MEDAREVMFAMALSAFIMWFLNFLAHVKSANPKNFNQEADGAQTDASAVEVLEDEDDLQPSHASTSASASDNTNPENIGQILAENQKLKEEKEALQAG